MIKFAYVVPEEEAGFTKYIVVTLDGYKSGVILDAVMNFVQNLLRTICTNFISTIFGYVFSFWLGRNSDALQSKSLAETMRSIDFSFNGVMLQCAL